MTFQALKIIAFDSWSNTYIFQLIIKIQCSYYFYFFFFNILNINNKKKIILLKYIKINDLRIFEILIFFLNI